MTVRGLAAEDLEQSRADNLENEPLFPNSTALNSSNSWSNTRMWDLIQKQKTNTKGKNKMNIKKLFVAAKAAALAAWSCPNHQAHQKQKQEKQTR